MKNVVLSLCLFLVLCSSSNSFALDPKPITKKEAIQKIDALIDTVESYAAFCIDDQVAITDALKYLSSPNQAGNIEDFQYILKRVKNFDQKSVLESLEQELGALNKINHHIRQSLNLLRQAQGNIKSSKNSEERIFIISKLFEDLFTVMANTDYRNNLRLTLNKNWLEYYLFEDAPFPDGITNSIAMDQYREIEDQVNALIDHVSLVYLDPICSLAITHILRWEKGKIRFHVPRPFNGTQLRPSWKENYAEKFGSAITDWIQPLQKPVLQKKNIRTKELRKREIAIQKHLNGLLIDYGQQGRQRFYTLAIVYSGIVKTGDLTNWDREILYKILERGRFPQFKAFGEALFGVDGFSKRLVELNFPAVKNEFELNQKRWLKANAKLKKANFEALKKFQIPQPPQEIWQAYVNFRGVMNSNFGHDQWQEPSSLAHINVAPTEDYQSNSEFFPEKEPKKNMQRATDQNQKLKKRSQSSSNNSFTPENETYSSEEQDLSQNLSEPENQVVVLKVAKPLVLSLRSKNFLLELFERPNSYPSPENLWKNLVRTYAEIKLKLEGVSDAAPESRGGSVKKLGFGRKSFTVHQPHGNSRVGKMMIGRIQKHFMRFGWTPDLVGEDWDRSAFEALTEL